MRITLWQATAVAALGLGLVIAPVAEANGPAKTATKKGAKGNASAALESLHQAKALLETAIHDYDGHRAKALEEVHHAIKELTPHVQGKGKGGAAANKAANNAANAGNKLGTTPGETQAQSDKQLKQALEILASVNGQIPAQHTKATTHVGNAVGELNTALKIK